MNIFDGLVAAVVSRDFGVGAILTLVIPISLLLVVLSWWAWSVYRRERV